VVNHINKCVRGRSNNLYIQFFRYIIAGAIGFFVDIFLLYLLTENGLYYLVSATFAFLVGLYVNYLLCIYWIFKRNDKCSKAYEFTFLIVTSTIIMIMNIGLMWLLTDLFELYYLYSKVIATFILFTLNFIIRRYYLFNN
jgi:putative flippase GtrA